MKNKKIDIMYMCNEHVLRTEARRTVVLSTVVSFETHQQYQTVLKLHPLCSLKFIEKNVTAAEYKAFKQDTEQLRVAYRELKTRNTQKSRSRG